MNRIYCYYGLFICLLSLVIILRSDSVIMTALDKKAINMAFFNQYSRDIDEYWFCHLCFNLIK